MSRRVTYCRREGLAHQKIEGETLVVVPKKRMAHQLNEVGTHVWEYLARPHSLDEIVESVAGEFEADRGRIRAEVEPYLRRMVSLSLVIRKP